MTILRTNPGGWAVSEKLTSAQMNAVDINVTNAVDKRSGQTDTVSSVLSMASAGRFIPTVIDGDDSDAIFPAGYANVIRIPGTLTGDHSYTLDSAAAITNDRMMMFVESACTKVITVHDQASVEMIKLSNDVAHAKWAEFIYIAGWRVFRTSKTALLQEAQVADLTALAATVSTGQIVFVPGYGFYYFKSGAATGFEDGLFQVRRGDNSGTWIAADFTLNKLRVFTYNTTILINTTSSTYVTPGGASYTVPVVAGDRLELKACCQINVSIGSGDRFAQLFITDPGAVTTTGAQQKASATTGDSVGQFDSMLVATMGTSGNATVGLQMRNNDGTSTVTLGAGGIISTTRWGAA